MCFQPEALGRVQGVGPVLSFFAHLTQPWSDYSLMRDRPVLRMVCVIIFFVSEKA